MDCCLKTNGFFTFVQNLFNFFSKSTWHWQILTTGVQCIDRGRIETLKSLSETRWSAHAQAVHALYINYENIHGTLKTIAEDENQNITTRSEAETLHNQMDNLEVAFLTVLWDTILRRCNNVSEYLQKVEMDLSQAHELITSLRDFISGLRDQFDMFEGRAKELSNITIRQTHREPDATKNKQTSH